MSARFVRAVFTVARRDIVATVFSKGFLVWLLTPVIALAFGLLVGAMAGGDEEEESATAAAAVIDTTGDFAPYVVEVSRQERSRTRYAKLRARYRAAHAEGALPDVLSAPADTLLPTQLAALDDDRLDGIERDYDLGVGDIARRFGADTREDAITLVSPAPRDAADARRQAERLLRPGSDRFGAVLLVTEEGTRILRRSDKVSTDRLRDTAVEAWERRAVRQAGIEGELTDIRAATPRFDAVTVARPKSADKAAAPPRDQTSETLGTFAIFVLFMLNSLLAGALLSNMVEEKGNKVIEILVASVPVPSIFAGKLIGMVIVSLVGISVWGLIFGGGAALFIAQLPAGVVPAPDRGWALFSLMVLGYFICAYLIYGALFLGIGSLCSSIREVQTLSMPVTILQMLVLVVTLRAISSGPGAIQHFASWFPLSAPYMMAARAAGGTDMGIHLLAYAWQIGFAGIVILFSSRLFRYGVLRSGPPPSFRELGRSAKFWARGAAA